MDAAWNTSIVDTYGSTMQYLQATMTPAVLLLHTAIVLTALYAAYSVNPRMWWPLRGVPGPRALPVLGHLPALARQPVTQAYKQWMDKYGPVFLVWLGRQPAIVLSDPELIRLVGIKHFAKFHDRSVPPFAPVSDKQMMTVQQGILLAKGPYWASLRAALQPLFHTQRLAGFAPVMTAAADTLASNLQAPAEAHEVVNISEQLGRMTMEAIGTTAFGVQFDTQHPPGKEDSEIVQSAAAVFAGGAGSFLGALLMILPRLLVRLLARYLQIFPTKRMQEITKARVFMYSTSAHLINNTRKERSVGRAQASTPDWKWWPEDAQHPYSAAVPAEGSVIDLLARANVKGGQPGAGLGDHQIAANCNTMMLAGYETTSTALAFTIYLLAQHPEVEARLLAEIDAFGRERAPAFAELSQFPYTEAVLNEAMRLYPPAPLSGRQCNETCMVDNLLVPKGTWVQFNIWGIHHSAQYWPDPEVFRPERFLDETASAARHPHAFLPFGLGPRNCIGMRFAVEEARIALVRLYQRYAFCLDAAHHPPGAPLELRFGITMAPKRGIWVRPCLRG